MYSLGPDSGGERALPGPNASSPRRRWRVLYPRRM